MASKFRNINSTFFLKKDDQTLWVHIDRIWQVRANAAGMDYSWAMFRKCNYLVLRAKDLLALLTPETDPHGHIAGGIHARAKQHKATL